MRILKQRKNFILALALFLGWPLLATAQYYIPFGKKPDTQQQYQTPQEKPKKESFLSRYILGRKAAEQVEKKRAQPAKIVREASPKDNTEMMNKMALQFVPSSPDPLEAQWLAQDQALRAKVSPPPLLKSSTDITGPCTEPEAKAFKAIEGNFQQVVKERNARRDDTKTRTQLDNFMKDSDNFNKTMFLYMKCGGSQNT